MRVEFHPADRHQLEAQLAALAGQRAQALVVFRRRLELVRAAPTVAALLAFRSVDLRPTGDGGDIFVMPVADAVGVRIRFSDEGDEPAAIVSGVTEYEKA